MSRWDSFTHGTKSAAQWAWHNPAITAGGVALGVAALVAAVPAAGVLGVGMVTVAGVGSAAGYFAGGLLAYQAVHHALKDSQHTTPLEKLGGVVAFGAVALATRYGLGAAGRLIGSQFAKAAPQAEQAIEKASQGIRSRATDLAATTIHKVSTPAGLRVLAAQTPKLAAKSAATHMPVIADSAIAKAAFAGAATLSSTLGKLITMPTLATATATAVATHSMDNGALERLKNKDYNHRHKNIRNVLARSESARSNGQFVPNDLVVQPVEAKPANKKGTTSAPTSRADREPLTPTPQKPTTQQIAIIP